MPLRPRPIVAATLIAAGAFASAAMAQPELYGAPSQGWTPDRPAMDGRGDHGWAGAHRRQHGGGECYAKVRFGPQYSAPPTGPEYVWTQAPGPPGSPGPIWCLTVQSLPQRPLITPERYGWVRVLCDTDATPGRVADVQRRLHDRGLYRGDIDGRYDDQTTLAVRRFQSQQQIQDRGYLSYQTLTALQVAPPPQPIYYRQPTAFDTGVLDWPGKSRF